MVIMINLVSKISLNHKLQDWILRRRRRRRFAAFTLPFIMT